MDIKILVVEDDADINGLLCNILSKKGYDVRGAFSGSEALMCIDQFEYDLVLLDLMLPGVSGEDIINKIRKDKIMPIIVISAKITQDDKINALKLGADDYITKPFDINEVLARVESQLRRYKKFSNSESNDGSKIKYNNLVLDKESKQVFINDKEISLTVREFKILELLMSNPNKVFTRANIFESVWDNEFLGDDNTVNVHVSNLRLNYQKLIKMQSI